jgi:glycosyltransferase involved in cell wall biosynthesis
MHTDLSSPLVSIIALCYNHEPYVTETLQSIINQTYTQWELVIMDDGSSDGSVKMINEWIDQAEISCKFIPHEVNKGICKTLNEALEHCNGDFIQIIACDDILFPEKLEKQVELFENSSNKVAVVYSDAHLINDQGEKLNKTNIGESVGEAFSSLRENIYEALLKGNNFIPAGTALIRAKVIEKVGRYDEELSYEDLDMWLRISKDYEFLFSEYISVYYRWHGENLSKKIYRNFRHLESRYRIFRKHYGNTSLYNSLIEKKLFSAINGMQNISLKRSFPFIIDFIFLTKNFKLFIYTLKKAIKRTLKPTI